jgi:predicted RNase H-like HicB family nuclease
VLSKGLLIFGEKIMKYRIFIEQDEDGIFVAECPSLPGCISQGETRKQAIENIQDAIRGYLESLEKHNEPIPPSIDEEIVEVAL